MENVRRNKKSTNNGTVSFETVRVGGSDHVLLNRALVPMCLH